MPTAEKFDGLARSLHWLSALVILWATFSGTCIAVFTVSEDLRHTIADFNVAITVVFIPFFLWRVLYRLRRGVPAYGDLLSTSGVRAAYCVHLLMYAMTAVVLVSGVLMMTRDINVFNLMLLPNLINDVKITDFFNSLHIYSSRLLGLLVLLHVGAVFKHQLGGVAVLQRML